MMARTAAISLLLLQSGAGYAQENAAANPAANPIDTLDPVHIPAPAKTGADPALWVVKDADTTIYLFGTIHALKPNSAWFDKAVKAAFDTSQTLVLEQMTPSAGDMQTLFSTLAIDKSGTTLRSKLNSEERAKFDAAMTKLGLPITQFDPFDPWAAGLTIQLASLEKDGFNAVNGAENILTSAAKLSKKQLIGLETTEYQLRIFDDLPLDAQIRFLISGSAYLDQGTKTMNDLVERWAAGDANGLAELMNAGLAESSLYDKLLTQRNANWARWINQRMKTPGQVFIAVGAGHLAGTASVQHMLTAYQLNAQRVEY
jgi:uncharacterized protein